MTHHYTSGDATELKPTVMASVPEILERIRKGMYCILQFVIDCTIYLISNF